MRDAFGNDAAAAGEPVPPSGPASSGVDVDDVVTVDVPAAPRKKPKRPFWQELPFLVVLAITVAVIIKAFFFQAFFIPSGSMENTLQINDRVLVNKIAYRIGDPARKDVVVFDRNPIRGESLPRAIARNVGEAIGLITPKSDLIKRIIGLPGETVEIVDNVVLIDGIPIDEPYLKPGSQMPDFGPVTVPPGEYFVMGDNRNASRDSRFDGTVPGDQIIGKAILIIWPPSRWSTL